MTGRIRRAVGRLRGDHRGIAAVELAMLSPVYLMFGAVVFQLGYSYAIELKVVSATSAAAQFAYIKARTLTVGTLPAYLGNVQSVMQSQSGLGVTITATVLYNNVAGTGNFGTFYCLTNANPPVWTSTGASAGSCGGNVTSGKFVTITATATAPTFILPTGLASPTLTDTVIVRVQ